MGAAHERAPLPYSAFRSGWTFRDVRQMLLLETRALAERGEYITVTRRRVLGRMRQLKLEAYDFYLREFESDNRNVARTD